MFTTFLTYYLTLILLPTPTTSILINPAIRSLSLLESTTSSSSSSSSSSSPSRMFRKLTTKKQQHPNKFLSMCRNKFFDTSLPFDLNDGSSPPTPPTPTTTTPSPISPRNHLSVSTLNFEPSSFTQSTGDWAGRSGERARRVATSTHTSTHIHIHIHHQTNPLMRSKFRQAHRGPNSSPFPRAQ